MIITQLRDIMTEGGVKGTSSLNIIITRLNMLIVGPADLPLTRDRPGMCRVVRVTRLYLSRDYPV